MKDIALTLQAACTTDMYLTICGKYLEKFEIMRLGTLYNFNNTRYSISDVNLIGESMFEEPETCSVTIMAVL